MSLCLFLVPTKSQDDARAGGFPTIDIANLLQGITQALQDADISGLFDWMSDHGINLETYLGKIEDVKKYLDFATDIVKKASYAVEIADMTYKMIEEVTFYAQAAQYMSSCGATASTIYGIGQVSYAYRKYFEKTLMEHTKEFKDVISTFSDSSNESSILKWQAVRNMSKEISNELIYITAKSRYDISCLARKERILRSVAANGNIRELCYL